MDWPPTESGFLAVVGALGKLPQMGMERPGSAAHPVRPASQEEARAERVVVVDTLVSDQGASGASGGHDLLDRPIDHRPDLRMIWLAGVAHRLGEVGGSNEEDVDVIDGENLGEVVD